MVLAWDGTFSLLAAFLNLAGYRVTSANGHHLAALNGVRAPLDSAHRPLLDHLGDVRRMRNRALYDGIPPAVQDIEEAADDLESLAVQLESALADGDSKPEAAEEPPR